MRTVYHIDKILSNIKKTQVQTLEYFGFVPVAKGSFLNAFYKPQVLDLIPIHLASKNLKLWYRCALFFCKYYFF